MQIKYPDDWEIHNWDFTANLGNYLQRNFEEKMAALEDEQMKHREAPSDAEMNAMSERYEYDIAH
jgi:hypothetical protein